MLLIVAISVLLMLALALAVYGLVMRRREARLQAEVRDMKALVREKRAFGDTSRLIAANMNRATLIMAFLDGARQHAHAESAAVLLQTAPGETEFHALAEAAPDPARISEALERLLREESLPAAPSIRRFSELDIFLPEYSGLRNALIVPLTLREKTFGNLIVCNRAAGTDFTGEDEEILSSLGAIVSLALERIKYCDEARELALKDSLTRLNNYRSFQDQLAFEIERARRYGNNLGLLIIDIDDFKRFNMTYGHEAGDNALKSMAALINQGIRSIDLSARYGGEEFTAILVQTSPEASIKTAERIRQAVEEFKFDTTPGKLTVSIGVASFPSDARDKEELLKEADSALYIAKKRGKNRVQAAGKLTVA